MVDIQAVRDRLRALDEQIIRSAAERTRIARELAASKAAEGRPTVDYGQERRVLDQARRVAEEHGLDTSVADALAGALIDAAVTAQEDERIRLHAGGHGRVAVVVGGAGRMGRWLDAFLAAQGHEVYVLDPAAPDDLSEAEARLPDADLVMVATPPRRTAMLYQDWTTDPPKGVICDVASIKTPLAQAVQALRDAGGRVASIHPMFGPSQRVLRGVDLVVCETGDAPATEAVEDLFRPTAARVLRVPFDDHDRWMADVLALAHATTLAFATSLPPDPIPARSTTLGRLSDLAWGVVNESPEVYFEIQAHNPHARDALARLRAAIGRLDAAVEEDDPEAFAGIMEAGRRLLAKQREVTA